MTKPALAASRAAAVLGFLAANRRRAFTLTELSAAVDVNRPSLLSVLAALEEHGLLQRHPVHRTYSLGAGAVALGDAALAQHPAIAAVRPLLVGLVDELGTEVVLAAPAGDEAVILDVVGDPPAHRPVVVPGQRLPVVAPLGAVFVAWSAPDVLRRWVGGGDVEAVAPILAAIRRRGWSASLASEPSARVGRLVGGEAAGEHPAPLADLRGAVLGLGDYQVGDLDPEATYAIATISAPVFDADGRVALVLSLPGDGAPLTGAALEARAGRLVVAARAATRASGGREPALG